MDGYCKVMELTEIRNLEVHDGAEVSGSHFRFLAHAKGVVRLRFGYLDECIGRDGSIREVAVCRAFGPPGEW